VSVVAILAALRRGERRAREVVEDALDAAERHAGLNAFTAITAARARAEADAVDAGRVAGPLAGVPFAAKNLFDLAGVTTLAGAAIERGRPPATRDATLVARFAQAGACCLGATNMDEYAYGFTTENTAFGATRNPHDAARVAGGSSGGSAAAVAAGIVPVALGSDTNGSIRVPAALCGVFGLKPTYGRLSRRGARLFSASLDHVGPFARDVADLALAYDALQGLDAEDAAQAPRAVEPVTPLLGAGIGGLRVAVAAGHFAEGGEPAVFAAVEAAARALGATRRVLLPEAARARAAAALITMGEGGNLHLPALRERAAEFDPLTRDRFLAGALLPATWLLAAQRFRRRFHAQTLALFGEVDVILTPATPYAAPPIGTETLAVAGSRVPARPTLGLYTQPFSFIGLPAMVVPFAASPGLPLGIQVVAAPWREDHLFRTAAALEAAGIAACPPIRR
jgi:amidase/aspartyl-tRNA(Asn)/glutamyl-tRNA(Gln) amidotransferase subunit A